MIIIIIIAIQINTQDDYYYIFKIIVNYTIFYQYTINNILYISFKQNEIKNILYHRSIINITYKITFE